MDRGGFLKRICLALGLLAAPPTVRDVIADIEPQIVPLAEPVGDAGYYGMFTAGGLVAPLYLEDLRDALPMIDVSRCGPLWPRPE